MRSFIIPLVLLSIVSFLLFASCGEDRSGEQPFAPTVESVSAEVVADSALLTGHVVSSPNSSLTACGFYYGNDTIDASCAAPAPTETFVAVTDSLGAGDYYAVAYATNGMGTSLGDTIYFTIAAEQAAPPF